MSKSQGADNNLELLVMREKLSKQHTGADIGQYYNEKYFSSFSKYAK